MSGAIDITGQRFGRLVVVRATDERMNGSVVWACLCDCGNTKNVRPDTLKNGAVRSCGCLCTESRFKHRGSRSPAYKSWTAMISRCTNPGDPGFARYGGRGIDVDPDWMRFENFLSDMGDRPPGTSLDRMRNDDSYSKRNCRWATPGQQANNRRCTVMVTHDGETKPISIWAQQIGISRSTLYKRIVTRKIPPSLALKESK